MQAPEEPANDEPHDFIGAIRRAVNSLDPTKRDQALQIAADCGILEDKHFTLLWWVHRISHFEESKQPSTMTPQSRRKALTRVENAATELLAALGSLAIEDQCRLEELRSTELQDLDSTAENLLSPETAVVMLQAHAALIREGIQGGERGGRPRTIDVQVGFIEGLWMVADGSGMPLGSNGPFERFCDDIFTVCGRKERAEGPVAEFVKRHKTRLNQAH